jgi:predicted  nucleic acid-binding Zn-ribbon protein
MNKKIVSGFLMVLAIVALLSGSFFTYSFLDSKSKTISTTNTELRDELLRLKEKQNDLKTEKTTLDKQYSEIEQKLSKFNK